MVILQSTNSWISKAEAFWFCGVWLADCWSYLKETRNQFRKSFPKPVCWSISLTLSAGIFKVSSLTLSSLIHLQLICEQVEWEGQSFILMCVDMQFSKCHFLMMLSFLQWVAFAPLWKLRWLEVYGPISGLFYNILFKYLISFISTNLNFSALNDGFSTQVLNMFFPKFSLKIIPSH